MTSIRKANTISAGHDIVVLCYKLKQGFGLSAEEFAYLKDQHEKNEKKMVVFNRLKYLLVFVIADTKAEKNLRHEILRKNANDVCALLNGAKSANVLVVDETNEKENALSFAEGLALSNYQFFRHKPSATKEKNTLQNISVHNNKISDKDIADLNAVVQATIFARDLVNEPVSHLNAEGLAKEFQK
ncbi:MAG: hypothetical protein IAF38_01680, partial [Bacteroidia bacterium]|nr:hypothetical protein [Bacteroidia bacterium]